MKPEFFQQVFGFLESPERVKDRISVKDTSEGVLIHSHANNKTYNSGFFKIVTANSFRNLEKRGNGKLFIINGNGRYTKDMSMVDVLQMQSRPDNNGATFQAASNFNCLEFVSPRQTAWDGISNYIYDKTQGPSCAIACVCKNYYFSSFFLCNGTGTFDFV
jgi:hypothetical protein